jgi:hypothetical protein
MGVLLGMLLSKLPDGLLDGLLGTSQGMFGMSYLMYH